MSQSVVFQVYSETGTFGIDMAIVATSVIQVLRRQGIEAYVRNEGLEGLAWSEAHDVPEADETTLETCEVLLRAWPVGQWPERPDGPRTVVDFVRRPADRSHNSDFVVAFEADGTAPFPGLLIWDVLFPLPVEVNEVIKETVEDVIMIHLGQDPTSRLSGLQLAINGFAGMMALGLQYPGGAGGPGIIVTPTPWDHLASGDVAIVTPEFPFRLAAAMRVPAVLLGFTPDELSRVQELTTRGHSSFLSLQLSSGLTNNQIRDAARDFRNCDTAKRVARLAGSEQQADEGVMRIASWVARELIGFSVISADPFNVQGFDTILDPHTKVPLNAAQLATEEGAPPELEDEVQVDVFTADGTWTKPDNAKFVHVRMTGGGSGGGSGRRGAVGTNRGGGGGGSSGTASEAHFAADALPPTVAVTVGQGGAGALGAAADSTDGTDGSNGTQSVFGPFLRNAFLTLPLSSTGGLGGTNISGGAGGVNSAASYLGGVLTPGGGGGGFAAGTDGGDGLYATGGAGGGGGGISVLNVADVGGAGGDGATERSVPLPGGAAGSATVQDGGDGASAEAFNVQGGGGAGGGASNGAVPGQGGAGGYPGGGGGGGSASLNGTVSGAGGQGANGLVVVTTFF